MYWYKPLNIVRLFFCVSGVMCFFACKPDIKETGATLKYFDIKCYFTGDTARLNHQKNPVLKTITYNGQTEQKTVHINNWGLELDSFIGSDINRPAWKNSYDIFVDSSLLVYKAKYPELKMRRMVIKKENGKVKWILIFNKTKNIIYQTTQKLSYFPDSLYIIDQYQKVRLMKANHYKIQGVIKQ
jgi:hypothetical protein